MDANLKLSTIEEGRQNFRAASREHKDYDQQEDSLFQQDGCRSCRWLTLGEFSPSAIV